MDISIVTAKLLEFERRRPNVNGHSVKLADGGSWLLASPVFLPRAEGLTRPMVDQPLDNLFERSIRGENLEITDLFSIAKSLLLANYELSNEEVETLLEVAPGLESRTFFEGLLSALFGVSRCGKSYTHWIRASLLANGIGIQEIPAGDLLDVIAILVATNRTVPLSKFADACHELDEQSRLEMLI